VDRRAVFVARYVLAAQCDALKVVTDERWRD